MRPLMLNPVQAYSPASIGRTYLRRMDIRPILERQPDFPKSVLGYAMGAYYGGWTEGRIRRVPVPVAYVDFLSMYPTVCTLMGLWRFLTCERIEVDDSTEEVRDLLARITLEDCLNPDVWSQFVGLVQILPQGDIIPSRAPYGGTSQRQIGVNPVVCDEPLWYTIPDAVASKLRTGRVPHVTRALRLVPRGTNPNLHPVTLRGAVSVDPRTDDFFKVVIEERKRASARVDLPAEERKRLDRFLKVLANSTSYGIFVEMRRNELPPGKYEAVTVYGLDEEPFNAKVIAPEEPGEFTFPPLGALISGGGRLMLAILERIVTDAGGVFAFCDTDSMAIVATEHGGLVPCPGGPERLPDGTETVRALSWEEVEGIRDGLAALNPYDKSAVPGSTLKLEEVNFDPISGGRRQLYCYAISAKRYALFLLEPDGKPILRQVYEDGNESPIKLSEHGLGHLLNPADPEDESRDWITILWEGIITEALGHPYSWPDWISRPAACRLTISTWRQLALFDVMNRHRPYADRIKPGNFLLSFHVAPFGHPPGVDPERFHLFAAWTPDARQWLKRTCIDYYSGKKFRITTNGFAASEGVARVKTYADVLAEYRVHSEPKSVGPDGQPCGRATIGLLRRRPVTATHVVYIGKESNRLEEVEAGVLHHPDEVLAEYTDPRRDPWRTLVLPVLQGLSAGKIARKLGLERRTVQRLQAGRSYPHPKHKAALLAFASQTARASLQAWGISPPTDDLACCSAYLEEQIHHLLQVCPICQAPFTRPRARYCSAACRQRAYRLRVFSRRLSYCQRSADRSPQTRLLYFTP